MPKVNEEVKLYIDLAVEKAVDRVMEKGDTRWASKLTQNIVFTASGLILTAVLVALIGLVVKAGSALATAVTTRHP